MIAVTYASKKALKAAIGKPLRYIETSAFGTDYKADGKLTFVGPGPYDRRYYGTVTMKNGLIEKVI